MKTLLTFAMAILITLMGAFAQKSVPAKPSSSDAKMNAYINGLMAKMTLEEKIGQLNLPSVGFDVTGPIVSQDVDAKIKKGQVGAVFNTFTPNAVRKLQQMAVTETRLGIPLLFGYDVIHGHRTIFPIPLALSCSWDPQLVEQSARISATEATADGLNWLFSPMVDICRDPRWGRIAEGSGEDPYLGARMAEAVVKGFQGDDLAKDNTAMACVKHFALYGGAEAGRDYNTVDMSMSRMLNEYLPPYKAAFDAGAATAMSSFNEINGMPATCNKWLLTNLLRDTWGFKGFVVSDYTAVNELIEHHIGPDLKDVSRQAINAGLDMDMVGEGFLQYLKPLVDEGKVSRATIDEACRRILEAKYKLGLFDDPYRYADEARAAKTLLSAENRAGARNIAAQSMVLLKNENGLLPLKTSGSIALIGPLADNHREMLGTWSGAGDWTKSVSVKEGIQTVAGPGIDIHYAKGCNLLTDRAFLKEISGEGSVDNRSDDEMIQEAFNISTHCDLIVAVLGEPAGMSGEAASRSQIGLPGRQQDLLKALAKTGKPIVLVLMNGRPLTLAWEDANIPSILEAWHAGTEAGNAVADVLFGKVNPSGKLSISFPLNEGQIPVYYNHKHTGRPVVAGMNEKYKSRYLDIPNEPLYPFGYGLSYTHFAYNDLQLGSTTIKPGEKMDVGIKVTNTGNADGYEVVQLYICDKAASLTRPIKELKAFKKVFLKAGESQNVHFALTDKDLSFYDNEGAFKCEAGSFTVFVGGNSRDCLEKEFMLIK